MTMTERKRAPVDTGAAIAAMLCENTGRALCDSGGYPQYDENGKYVGSSCGYGRNYERNAGREFDKEPGTRLHIGKYDIEFRIGLYHYLKAHLEFYPLGQRVFERFAGQPDNEHRCWLEILEAFPGYLRERGAQVIGLYGDENPLVVNTYNEENALDQDMQFMLLGIDGRDMYLIVQSHNGADARGGYSKPRVFTISDSDEAGVLCGYRDGMIVCEGVRDCPEGQMTFDGQIWKPPTHTWYTDDTCHWRCDDDRRVTNLEDCERVELPDGSSASELVKANPDTIFYDEEGVGYCPICGAALRGYGAF